jgi:Ca2+-binding RTX toxin-like protein
LSEALPDSLLDAPVWATTARATTNITAGSGNQTLTGTSGNDNLSGGAGDDVTIGGAGDDTHSVGSSRDQVVENAGEGIDTAVVYVKNYTLTANVENLRVNYASNGGTYKGNELDNILRGGVGSETLTGGLGDDLFVPSAGNDRIADFAAGPGNGDRIDLRPFTTFVGLDDVLAHATEAGTDTVIDLGSGNSLTLVNVAPAALADDDFLFTTVAPPPIVNQPPTDILLSNDVVAEGVGVGAVVGGLSAADPDDGESFTYTLVDDADGSFAIDGSSLVVAGPLDYETASSRDLIVRVTDSAGNAFEKSLTVNLTNEAPSLPVDADDAVNEISENTVTGAAVGIVASSGDVGGGTVTYALVDDAGGRFAIDAATGQVTVADASLIDYETAAEHIIVVQASDGAGAASTLSFTIGVANAPPGAPQDSDGASNQVAEGAANGTAVGIMASAADVNGGTLTYALLDNAGGRFAIDATTGLVTVADGSLLDHESASEHAIVVEASDASGATSTSTFTIGVANAPPTAPQDSDGASNQVVEGAADGTAAGLAAFAADINGGAVAYSLLDDAGGRFAIDADSGLVTVADGSLIDFETAAEHLIVVQATDAAGGASTASFTIGVGNSAPTTPEDADDAPNLVAEGAEDGAAVGIAVVSSEANSASVTYSLLDDAGGRFAIDAATGLVTVADGSLLDHETAAEHTIVVQASDASGAASTASFTIGVTNQAPTSPEDLDEASNQVAEGAADGTAVGIAVSSADVNGGMVAYALLDDAGGRFAIDAATGLVTVADGSLLDHETAAEHTIVVQASDAAGATSTSAFAIAVANRPPILPDDADEAPNQVAENATNGTAVGVRVSASDVSGGVVTYALLDDAGGRFTVDAATGLVTVADASLIDYEAATEHTIVVQASDASGASRTASFTIAVNDVSGVTVTGTNAADTVDATSTVSLKPLPTEEADVISTNGGDDYISALGGDDYINGGTGADTMLGGRGNDTYVVNSNTDILIEFEGEGVDLVMASVSFILGDHFENLTLTGSNGSSATGNALDNVIRGNDSSNLLAGLGGADTLIGGLGMDKAGYAVSAAGVNVSLATGLAFGGDAEGDTFLDIEGIIGSSFDDIIEGDGGKNVLVGGDGIDTLSYEHASGDITVSLNVTAGQLTGAGNDTISGFENVIGSSFADRLTGTTGANTLCGLGGNDTLVGDAGDDLLIGGAGDDSLTGGAGLDAFAFDFATEGLDTIADFLSGSDYLQISATGFGGGLSAGDLATLVTVADLAAAAGGEGGYFIFDNAGDHAGTVYWDETGGTSDDAQAFARLAAGTPLLPSDFHVV